MGYKAVLFDMDGTLLDTLKDIGLAANRTLEQYGFPRYELADYRFFVGRGAEYLVRRCLPKESITDDLVSEFLAAFLADYNENWARHTKRYPGIPELLDVLTEKRFKMCIPKTITFSLCWAHKTRVYLKIRLWMLLKNSQKNHGKFLIQQE